MTKETVLEESTSTIEKVENTNNESIDEIKDLIFNMSIRQKDYIIEDETNKTNRQDSLEYSKNEEQKENAEISLLQLDIGAASTCQSRDSDSDVDSDNKFDKITFSLDGEDAEEPYILKNESDSAVEKYVDKTSNLDSAKTSEDSESDDESADKSDQSSDDSECSTHDDSDTSGKCAPAEASSEFKDEVPLSSKLSLLYFQDESDDEEKEEFVTRGPLTDNKNHSSRCNRFSPMHPYPMIPGDNSQGFGHHRSSMSPNHENNRTASLYDSNYRQFSTGETLSQGFGQSQPFNSCGNTDLYASSSQLSPESIHSNSSPFYSSSFSLTDNHNAYGYQTEDTLDVGNNYGGNGFCENEDLKEEDLINVINSVNRTSKTEPKGIPETQTELSILQNVLEGNEYSNRDEMGMYLKNEDACFQPSFDVGVSPLIDSASQFSFNYESPLTPPKSVSPVSQFQDGSSEYGYSSSTGLGNNEDCQSLLYSEENLSFILDGIDEISRDEMNIYMGNENNGSDPSYARKLIQARCKPNNLDHALRKLSSLSLKTLCEKDSDGDTGLMIVYSSDEDSHDFYENIFCLQERVREIRVCCDAPLGKGKRCKICGNADPAKFYTPLSFKNNVGDTALSCAVKKEHSQIVVDYLLHGILQCKEDFRRVFDKNGREMLKGISYNYPGLWKYVMYQPGPA